MSNIQLTLIPTPDNFQLLDIFIGGNGNAAPQDLAELQLPPIDGRQGVLINGKAPVWLYAYLVHQCHAAMWVATMDPRLGAVVIETHQAAHDPHYRAAGSVIALEEFQAYLPTRAPQKPPGKNQPLPRGKVVALVGPPHSGKSVLLGALYRELQQRLPAEEFQRDVFLVRACPDGEGNWFSDIPAELAMTLRFKNQWDDAFAQGVCQNLETLAKTKRLVLVDVGGRIDQRNQWILNCCTHAVIVSRDPQAVGEWRGALQSSDVQLLAEVESTLEEVCEVLDETPFRCRIGKLERGRTDIALPLELIHVFK